jgi:hypothetical protein
LERAGDDDKQKRNALDGYLLVCTTNHQYATDKADLFVDSEWDEHQLDTVREMCKVTMDREESPEPEYDDSPLEL